MVANKFYLTTESDSFDAFSSYGNVESIVRNLTSARNSHTVLDEIEANLKNEIELLRELERELENSVKENGGDSESAEFSISDSVMRVVDLANARLARNSEYADLLFEALLSYDEEFFVQAYSNSVASVWRNVSAHIPLSKSALSKDKCAKFSRGKCARRAILANVDNFAANVGLDCDYKNNKFIFGFMALHANNLLGNNANTKNRYNYKFSMPSRGRLSIEGLIS